MQRPTLVRSFVAAAFLGLSFTSVAQFTTAHTITTAGDVTSTLGSTTFINHGLQGVGRISASAADSFGETFGSVSGLQITNWNGTGSYTGTFNILPDRGYNTTVGANNYFSDYAARIQQVNFAFTPYTGAANIGGANLSTKIAAQNQIAITSGITGVKFTYDDPGTSLTSVTTGLDPGTGTATIFGAAMPYVTSYTGLQSPTAPGNTTYTGINKLALDAEALVLKADGSGYIGDEYGANIYYFNASKKIIGAITPPAAIQPHTPVGTLNFNSVAAPTNGRRNNQGMEGVALSPDGTRLFALLQSAAIQDSSSAAQTRVNTRLVIYDVSSNATPGAPVTEYALQLPTYTGNGAGGGVNATAAQSEIVAIDNNRFLVLSRDANGLGSATANKSVVKSVLLVDLSVANPTNFAGSARDNEGGLITTAPGVLDPAITPLSWTEAINLLNTTQLSKFNIDLDLGGANQVSKLTLGEKWEGMSLVSANDPSAPNDFFLFVANDNDFVTSAGLIKGPDGTLVAYNAFNGYGAARVPGVVGDAADPVNNESDTTFLAYRVTIVPEPSAALLLTGGLSLLGLRRRRAF